MTHAKALARAAVAGVLLAGAWTAIAADWPQWRGANRDGKVSDFKTPAAWPKSLTAKWAVQVGTGDAPPVVVGDKVYVFARQGNNETTYCLDAASGKELWKDSVEAVAVAGAARQHPGPRSSPAVADGKVVTLGVGGTVSCLNAADGKVLWRKSDIKDFPRFYTAMSPLLVDGKAILHLGGSRSGVMEAFDLATGEEKWKSPGEGPAYASPVVMTADGTQQIVTEAETSIVGISAADGKVLWRIPFAASGMAYNAVTPIVDGQTVYYSGQGRGTHAVKISKDGDKFAAKEIWASDIGAQFATPVLSNGCLYGLSDRGALFCLNATDGKTAWTDANLKAGNYAGVIAAGDVIIALASNATLVAFQANDKAYTELANLKVSKASTFAHPVLQGNNLFIKDADTISLFVLE